VEPDTDVTLLGMRMERTTRWNFLCEAGNALLLGGYIGVVGPFGIPLAVRMGANSLEVGLIAAAPFIANLAAPYWASRSQHSRKLPWVVVPHLFWRSLLGLVGVVKNPAIITGLFLGANVGSSAANPAYGAIVQKVFPPHIRGRLMGYVRLILAGSMLVTTLVAGQLIDRFHPGWLFLPASVLGLLGLGVYALTREPADAGPPPGPLSKPNALEGLRLALSDRRFRNYLIAVLVFHGGVLLASPLYAVYQVRQMGLSNSQISYISVAWNIAWLVAFAVWGRVIDRKGAPTVVAWAAALYAGMPLAYALGGGWYGAALLGALSQGAADAALDLGGWNMVLRVNRERVGPYTSAAMTVAGIRGALGPLLGSFLLQAAGFEVTFLAAALLVAAGLAIFLLGRRGEAEEA